MTNYLFQAFYLLGGLAFFLFGMTLMGNALEKRAGHKLKNILGKMTSNKFKGFALGLVVTMLIQSSSATTVMLVGFVNSGVMSLSQSISVLFGANLGTSVTSWILSLSGIQGNAWYIQIMKPANFSPVLAFIGVLLFMFCKKQAKKDVGLVFLGFSILMYGMETMASAVEPFAELPQFQNALLEFSTNPILGVIVGTVFTALIQSSSASVGVLQALTLTANVSYGTVIPIVMGQNIGTCVSAMISSIGANKNAKRVAAVHLYFNLIATVILLIPFYIINNIVDWQFMYESASPLGVAIVHTVFKLIALAILMPASKLLEKLACLTVKDAKSSKDELLDERLIATPSVAIERCHNITSTMAVIAVTNLKKALGMLLGRFDEKISDAINESEQEVDRMEDKLGDYLVKLSSHDMTETDSREVTELLHIIGDFERISDHALNIAESSQEMSDKGLVFSEQARNELDVLIGAISEILDLTVKAFTDDDIDVAQQVEPLEQVVDYLSNRLRKRHIERLRSGICTIELGFVLTDILNNLERISDHCSNIASCIIERSHGSFEMHEYLSTVKTLDNAEFVKEYNKFKEKYSLKK